MPRPYAADSWITDGLEVRFRLAPGLTFHDGSPVTAADVAATYQAVLDPARASPHRAALRSVAAVRAADAQTVVFELTQPDPTFFEAATLGLLPARLAKRASTDAASLIGSGPYRIERVDRDGSVSLAAYPSFVRGRPRFPRIEIRVVPDALMRALAFQRGSIDLLENALDPDTLVYLSRRIPHTTVYSGPSSNAAYLGIRFDHWALHDRRVRRAIALAIDREAIVAHLLRGQARVATGLLPPEHWAYTGRVRRYRHRPGRAAHLLDQAGLPDPDGPGPKPRITFSYKTTTQELPRRIAEAFAAQLGRVGIQLSIQTYEWGTFYADIRRGSFHLYSLEWVGIADPDLYRRIYHSQMVPPVGANRGRYRNRRMDRLTERAAATPDQAARKRLYARVQRLAARSLPTIPLWWPDRIVVSSQQIPGFRPDPAGSLLAAVLEPAA